MYPCNKKPFSLAFCSSKCTWKRTSLQIFMEVVFANDLQLFNLKAYMINLKHNSGVLKHFFVCK